MLTHDLLRSLLTYDESSGVFTWNGPSRRGKGMPGSIAGSLSNKGYWIINIQKKRYMAHRLAWFWVHGEWPLALIDHKNGDKLDNRLSNLRPADNSQNGSNAGKKKSNTSGWKGVFLHRKTGLWNARITVNRKTISLGYFKDIREAAEEYMFAALEHHGEFARLE